MQLAQKLLHLKKAHPARFLVGGCYAAAAVVWLVLQLGAFALNRAAYAGGRLQPAQLPLSAFTPNDMTLDEESGLLLTTGGDPQLILTDTALRAENIRVRLRYAQPPWTAVAFWAAPGGPHSPRRMAYAAAAGGTLTFRLPRGGVQGLRLDLDTKAGNAITVSSITVNDPRLTPLFSLSAPGAAAWLGAPGLAACALSLVPRRGPRRRAGKAGAALG